LYFNTEDTARATNVIISSARLPRSFLLFRGPCFDSEHHLHSLGFVRSFAAWKLHTCHFNTSHIAASWITLNRRGYLIVYTHNPVQDSDDQRIFPLFQPALTLDENKQLCANALCDQHYYHSSLGVVKPRPAVVLGDDDSKPFYLFMSAVFIFEDLSGLSPSTRAVIANVKKVMKKKGGIFSACALPGHSHVEYSNEKCVKLLAPLLGQVQH